MKNDRLQKRIIRISALIIVIALLIGLILNIIQIADPVADEAVGSFFSGSKSAVQSIGRSAGSGLISSGTDAETSRPSANNRDGADFSNENLDLINYDFEGTSYEYNDFEQWHYNQIMSSRDKYPDSLLRLLEREPQSVHTVYNYLDFLADDSSYNAPNRATKESFEKAKMKSKYPYFLQWDTPWGLAQYSSNFFAVTGCGPTTFAMLVGGLLQDETITPEAASDFAKEYGYEELNGNGSYWSLFTSGVYHYGIASRTVRVSDTLAIKQALRNDQPVVLCVNHPEFTETGHFILVTEIENGLLKLQDSFSVVNTNRLWPIDEILQHTAGAWTFSKIEN